MYFSLSLSVYIYIYVHVHIYIFTSVDLSIKWTDEQNSDARLFAQASLKHALIRMACDAALAFAKSAEPLEDPDWAQFFTF